MSLTFGNFFFSHLNVFLISQYLSLTLLFISRFAPSLVYSLSGDNIHTASAIARQCGILTPGGIALEGPVFRNMTPKELDEVCTTM